MALDPAQNFVFAELLPLILKKSATPDLLCCRLVGQQWKQVASEIILKTASLKLTFELDPDNRTFFLVKRHGKWPECEGHLQLKANSKEDQPVDKTLPELCQLVMSHGQGHVTSSLPVDVFEFRFKSWKSNRNQAQLVSFVQIYGPKIRTLTLDNGVDYFVGHPGMPNFLLQYTPNLQFLMITETKHSNIEIPAEFRTHQGYTCNFTLAHLKHIEIDDRPENYVGPRGTSTPTAKILQHLLQIAPQLAQVSFNSLTDRNMVQIFQPSHLHLLHIPNFRFHDDGIVSPRNLDKLEKVVQAMVQSPGGVGLRQLELWFTGKDSDSDPGKRGTIAFRRILGANLNSLHSINLLVQAAWFLRKTPGLPALPCVAKLKVDFMFKMNFSVSGNDNDDDPETDPHVPGNSLSYLFPNLRTFQFTVWNVGEEDSAKNRFPFWNDRLEGVNTLISLFRQTGSQRQVRGSEAFPRSMELCPGTERFETRWPYCQFSMLLTPLWINLSQLTSLTLNLEIHLSLALDTFMDLDAAITGLSKETVTAIYNEWEQSGQWQMPKRGQIEGEKEGREQGQVERVNSSVLDLKHLRQLRLDFWFDENREPRVCVSGVSAKFGFDLMENLKVSIGYNLLKQPSCWTCAIEKTIAQWLKLHQPLRKFANVTLG